MVSVSVVSSKHLTYPVVEMFHSIQGEGQWMGANAFFIRLAGCDVGCPWCDTKISWSPKPHPQYSVFQVLEAVKVAQPSIVVITGGEPLIHDLNPLTHTLKLHNMQVHLETSGAHPFSGQFDWVTFSPKRFKVPHPGIYSQVNELKVVISEPADFIWAEQQAKQVPHLVVRYLQPEWNMPGSQDLIFEYVLRHPNWRMSLQTHKFLGVQ